MMPYPANHRAETKERIVVAARKLFNRHGFDGVSVQKIMTDAGLTHGVFYKYFTSKNELYVRAMDCFFTDPKWNNNWEGVHVDMSSADVGAQILRAYLSAQHLEEVDNPCPMVALPSDVTRSDANAKRAYQNVFEAMVGLLQRNSNIGGPCGRKTALAIAALCVGGMVVARASERRDFADEVRNAALDVALKLGGRDSEH